MIIFTLRYEHAIVLPDNFTFEQDDQLIVDFAQFIDVFNPELCKFIPVFIQIN